MWQYYYGEDESSLIYYLNEMPIIEISENYFKLIHLNNFVAHIVPKDESKKSSYSDVTKKIRANEILDNELTDDDLDVLKFKSLLKAKEMGWDVDISNLK